jgi:hypothetical protein
MCGHYNLGQFTFELRLSFFVNQVPLSPVQILNFVGPPLYISEFLGWLKQRPIIA